MSKTVQSASFKDIVKDIETFYADNSITAYCPWTCTTLNYKPLSVQQIREFIELQIKAQKEENQILGVFDVVEQMNKVITGNCIDGKTDLAKTLSIIDRDAIIVQLRTFTKSRVEVLDEHNTAVEVDLHDVVALIKGKKPSKAIRSKIVEFKSDSGSIQLELEIPTLHKDTLINSTFKSKFAPKLKQGTKGLEKVIDKLLGEMYFVELCKYISSITINSADSGSTVLRFDSLDVLPQSMQLLEKLPSNLIGAVSDYVESVKEYRDSFLSYTNSQDQPAPLEVDANIFTGI